MTLQTSLLGSELWIEVRDRSFRRASLDGVLGWFRYVNAHGHVVRSQAIEDAAWMLEAAGARDYRIRPVRPRPSRSASRRPRPRFALA
jgi:hypothetical protein